MSTAVVAASVAMDGTGSACEQLTNAFTVLREWMEENGLMDSDTDLGPDATPTGIGDPLADVLRNIDEVLDEQ